MTPMRWLSREQYEKAPPHARDFMDVVTEHLRRSEDGLSDGFAFYTSSVDDLLHSIAMGILAELADLGWHVNTDDYKPRSRPEGTE